MPLTLFPACSSKSNTPSRTRHTQPFEQHQQTSVFRAPSVPGLQPSARLPMFSALDRAVTAYRILRLHSHYLCCWDSPRWGSHFRCHARGCSLYSSNNFVHRSFTCAVICVPDKRKIKLTPLHLYPSLSLSLPVVSIHSLSKFCHSANYIYLLLALLFAFLRLFIYLPIFLTWNTRIKQWETKKERWREGGREHNHIHPSFFRACESSSLLARCFLQASPKGWLKSNSLCWVGDRWGVGL